METPHDTADNNTVATPSHEMSQNVTSLTPRQIRAAAMIAEGLALKDIAKGLKIRRETLSRWKHLPEFKTEMSRVVAEIQHAYVTSREEMRHNLQHEMTGLMSEAIGTLQRSLKYTYGSIDDRAKFSFELLKFLGAQKLFVPPVVNQLETKNS